MARWIGTGALALAWAGVGFAQPLAPPAPQPPAPATVPAHRDPAVGDVLTFRTAGQPVRQVRVTQVSGTPETDGLADVLDLGTGAKYSIPLKVVALMAQSSAADAPSPPPAAKPPARPTTASGLPSVAGTMPSSPPARGNGWPTPTDASTPRAIFRTTAAGVPASFNQPRPTDARAADTRTARRPDPLPEDTRTPLPPLREIRTLMQPTAPAQATTTEMPPPATGTAFPPGAQVASARQSDPKSVATPAAGRADWPVPDSVVMAAPERATPPRPAVTVTPSAASAREVAPTPPLANGITLPGATVKPPEYVVVPVLEFTAPPATPPVEVAVATPPKPSSDKCFGPPPVTPLAEPRSAVAPPVAAPVVTPVTNERGIDLSEVKLPSPEDTEAPAATVPAAKDPVPAVVAAAEKVMIPRVYASGPQDVVVHAATARTFPPPPPAPVQQASFVVAPPEPPTPAPPPERAELPAQMLREVQPFVNELFQALRPSVRERAATALSEGRYCSWPEVKATLAQAALSDPAPAVRAHCIEQLSKLGYTEASYVGYLGACAESGDPAVKQAASAALGKLTRR